MRYGIEIVPLGDYADPRNVMQLAQAAEAAGWEALLVWDHLAYVWGVPPGDPFVLLTAVATVTQRMKLVTSVSPMARYRPGVLARTLASLDLLSQGRVVFGAGLGAIDEEFKAFGEDIPLKMRAQMLDEGLELLDMLFSGEAIAYHGQYYQAHNVTFSPLPVQRPRPPFWIGGDSLAAKRRAARWDGWIIGTADENSQVVRPAETVKEDVGYILEHRQSGKPFDIVVTGVSNPDQRSLVKEYADAGATWWIESLHGIRGSKEDMLSRAKAGPPV